MEEPKQNKSMNLSPASPKGEEPKRKVKVRINTNREIAGVGKAGDVVSMDEAVAKKYESEGYVTILKEN